MPKDVVQELAPYFNPKILAKARYVIGVKRISVPGACNTYWKGLNKNNAVTVDNIILFASDPRRNLAWWAHELQHVVQYDKLEIEGFAAKYITSFLQLP